MVWFVVWYGLVNVMVYVTVWFGAWYGLVYDMVHGMVWSGVWYYILICCIDTLLPVTLHNGCGNLS